MYDLNNIKPFYTDKIIRILINDINRPFFDAYRKLYRKHAWSLNISQKIIKFSPRYPPGNVDHCMAVNSSDVTILTSDEEFIKLMKEQELKKINKLLTFNI